MRATRYMKDTDKFWRERERSRAALDKKRSSRSEVEHSRKRLAEDMKSLKNARIVSTKK
jgi:hypothetical protein